MSNEKLESAMEKINEANNRFTVLEIAERYTSLVKSGTEYKGPCPVCRAGHDRFYVRAKQNSAGCRKCDTGWHAVGLYAAINGIKPLAAALELLGEQVVHRVAKPKVESVATHRPDHSWETSEWQGEVRALVNEHSDVPAPWRKLTADTLKKFGCRYQNSKFDHTYGKSRPAVIIPWILGDGRFCSVKFRFDNDRPGLRYTSKGGGDPIIFGEHLISKFERLIIIEGEINCMSIFQVAEDFADVISIGGDANTPSKDYAVSLFENRGYDSVLVWMDEAEKAIKFAERFGEAGRPMVSPSGHDANDILGFGDEWLLEYIQDAFNPSVCSLCLGKGYINNKGLNTRCRCKEAN
jgi:hypothetical protein